MSFASVQIFVFLIIGQGNDEIKASWNCTKKKKSEISVVGWTVSNTHGAILQTVKDSVYTLCIYRGKKIYLDLILLLKLSWVRFDKWKLPCRDCFVDVIINLLIKPVSTFHSYIPMWFWIILRTSLHSF